MRIKNLALLLITASALAFTGCASKHGLTDRTPEMGPRSTNLLGIYEYHQEDFSYVGPNSFVVSTDELYTRNNYSGDRASFLWGLVTLKDY